MPFSSPSLAKKAGRTWSLFMAMLTTVGLLATTLLWAPPVAAQSAVVEATETMDVAASAAATTLFGRSINVSIEASETLGVDAYNLSFNATLPAHVSYVNGSTQLEGQSAADPIVLSQDSGSTVLVWTNVSDLLRGTSPSLSFSLDTDSNVFGVGDSVDIEAGAFVNTDPRFIPDFDAVSGASIGDATAAGSASARTTLSPFELTKNEPSAESELLRGVHAHQTVFTLALQNNFVNQTTGFSIIDFIPAGLEFLGCGDVDHSSLEEYPGAGRINPGNAPSMSHPCVTPTSVGTVAVDPDGNGPLAEDIYTRVEWDAVSLAAQFGSADLDAAGSISISYVAAIPLRRNELLELADPTANLDNNTGALTADEEVMIGHATARGDYASTLPSTADVTDEVVAEDVSIHLTPSSGFFRHGSSTTWTMLTESSEYAQNTSPIIVNQTLPDGLDFVASNPPTDAGFPVVNDDGTVTLRWTLDGFDAPSSLSTISLETVTRSEYRATGLSVAARDAWSSTTASTATATVIADNDGSATVLLTPDASSGRQTSSGPTIIKEIAEPVTPSSECGDGTGLQFTADVAGPFGPGDLVCWRLTVEIPDDLDVLSLTVEDHLPAGFDYQGHTATAANGAMLTDTFAAADGVLRWDLGDVTASAERFQVVVETIIVDPGVAAPSDLTGNLMKVRHLNTAGSAFQFRDEAHAEWGAPRLDLVAGVIDVNDVPVANAPADDVQIEAGDTVTTGIVVTNSGNVDALDTSVRHGLPSNTSCSDISTISDAGRCSADDGWIQWDGLQIGAGETTTLTHDLEIPAGITAAVSMRSTAGVRSYEAATNTGARFVYLPGSNIDTTLASNTYEANDPWSIHTARPTIAINRSTSINETGNAAGNQATIGETISYVINVTLPRGTTFYGQAELSNDLGARVDLDESSVTATLDGETLPEGWTLSKGDNEVTVTFDNTYVVPLNADHILRLEFDATVNDVSLNTIDARIRHQAVLTWDNEQGSAYRETNAINTKVVEPVLSLAKSHDDADSVIAPEQVYRYTVTVSNGTGSQTAVAHDVEVVDTVSAQLTVLEGPGDPAENGDTVGPNGGVWNAAARTITWPVSALSPGASQDLRYDVQASTPLTATAPLSSQAEATASSMAGMQIGERDARSASNLGYQATASDVTNGPSLALATTMDRQFATVGESIDVSIELTIPANTIGYDVTVVDDLPIGLVYESMLSATCSEGTEPCSSDIEAIPASSGEHNATFLLGDLLAPSTADRTVTITYRAYVADLPAVASQVEIRNEATGRFNRTNKIIDLNSTRFAAASFDAITPVASATASVVEPLISLDKNISGQDGDSDVLRATPGTTLTYSIIVTNNDAPGIGAAYGLTVTDAPDARLLDLVDLTTAEGVTLLDGDQSDGALSWSIAGPVLPGESVTITYQLTVPTGLDWDDELQNSAEVTNTADVTSYFGVSAVGQATNPSRSFRRYDQVADDVVDVELDLASISGLVWHDADADALRDADESGIEGVTVIVTYLGPTGTVGAGDDEVSKAITEPSGAWAVPALPGGKYTVEIDRATIPEGMAFTYDTAHGAVNPDGTWNGSLNEDQNLERIDAGLATSAEIAEAIPEGIANDSDVWVVGLKPDGTAHVRMRTADDVWSTWVQQGSPASWASMTVNTDRLGNVWIVGVKLDGQAYVRTKAPDTAVNEGWSSWYRQGSGGWASMSLSIDPSGNVWIAGVKSNGLGYVRVKNAGTAVNQSWSGWVRLGSTRWSSVSIATDTSGALWLAGVTNTGAGYVQTRAAGGDFTSNWSRWVRQGSGNDWASLNLATDSDNNVWINGVKDGGTAYVRIKQAHASPFGGWSSWMQLGASNSWSSMTVTVDDADTLWVAGVKHSGTAYVRMKCFCPGVDQGWSAWWQQGSVNTWSTMTVTTDPIHRIMLGGLKLDGTALTRTKNAETGINHGWSSWHQHGRSYIWETFTPHSNGWTGLQPPKSPTLEAYDTAWVAPAGWNPATHKPVGGSQLYC